MFSFLSLKHTERTQINFQCVTLTKLEKKWKISTEDSKFFLQVISCHRKSPKKKGTRLFCIFYHLSFGFSLKNSTFFEVSWYFVFIDLMCLSSGKKVIGKCFVTSFLFCKEKKGEKNHLSILTYNTMSNFEKRVSLRLCCDCRFQET